MVKEIMEKHVVVVLEVVFQGIGFELFELVEVDGDWMVKIFYFFYLTTFFITCHLWQAHKYYSIKYSSLFTLQRYAM